jgi:predicted acylesterase/phospholipase RssA
MFWGFRPRALTLLLLFAGPPLEAFSAPERCTGNLDPILTIGWPVGRADEIPALTRLIESFHRQIGNCPNRSLQVNVAYGTDYELLAWISSGAIDAALLTPLAADLAQRDGVALLPVSTWDLQKVVLEPAGASLEAFFDRVEELGEAGAERVFLSLPSHLSNELYVLLEVAAGHVARRRLDGPTFWPQLFAHLCFRPLGRQGDESRPCVLAPNDRRPLPVESALALRHERAPAGAAQDLEPRLLGTLPEWLAVRSEIARSLFDLESRPNDAFPPLAVRTRGLLEDAYAPREIRELALADPRLGTRGFRFTIGEAVGLLQAHGAATGESQLALVLPGGGVKAAYQTTVLDALYGQRWLQNPLGRAYGPAQVRDPLTVDLVTGTSGGALVGYFVARLNEDGPFDLTRRLWFHGGRPLDHDLVFPGADLLRYLSLVVVFLLFSLALLVAAARRNSPFSLESRRLAPEAAARYRSRPLLAVAGTVLLLATPFAVRLVNGARQQEHIPDVEGFLFLVLALLAMFADQCLVAVADRREELVGRVAAGVTFCAGLAAVAVPLLAIRPGEPLGAAAHRAATAPVEFWAGFGLLAPLFVVPILIGQGRQLGQGTIPGASGFLRGVVEFLLTSGLTLALFLSLAPLRRAVQSASPFVFGLLLLGALLFFFLRPPAHAASRRKVRFLYYLSLFVAALFLLSLTRPAAEKLSGRSFGELLQLPSMLDVGLGSLSVSMGCVLLFAGFLFGLGALRPRYRLENVPAFALGLAACLVHAGLTFGVVYGLAKLGRASVFELEPRYWLVLAPTALALAAFGLVAAALFSRGLLREAFEFLASPHPNGRFRVRRHVRMVHFALFAWGFWNLVVAPGLYGNGPAKKYLERAALDFCLERSSDQHCQLERQFTAALLVPANALQNDPGQAQEPGDGSRFFLIVPKGQPCPTIPRNPAGGGRWHVFHVGSGEDLGQEDETCLDLDSPSDIQSMIFASGSPFPVFPAHRVPIPGESRAEFLVDGGYSNNVPISPGQNLGIDQVLVVDSTPVASARTPSALRGKLAGMVGSLVNDFLRLPGYLFGRAQVLDLQSRRDFFVVRIAPEAPEPGEATWPFLTDFRAEVVTRLQDAATRDLGRRVARVESWGKPRFVRSWRAEGKNGAPR